eukprot:6180711-Pleurochrysis_carterae.AAC.3
MCALVQQCRRVKRVILGRGVSCEAAVRSGRVRTTTPEGMETLVCKAHVFASARCVAQAGEGCVVLAVGRGAACIQKPLPTHLRQTCHQGTSLASERGRTGGPCRQRHTKKQFSPSACLLRERVQVSPSPLFMAGKSRPQTRRGKNQIARCTTLGGRKAKGGGCRRRRRQGSRGVCIGHRLRTEG